MSSRSQAWPQAWPESIDALYSDRIRLLQTDPDRYFKLFPRLDFRGGLRVTRSRGGRDGDMSDLGDLGDEGIDGLLVD